MIFNSLTLTLSVFSKKSHISTYNTFSTTTNAFNASVVQSPCDSFIVSWVLSVHLYPEKWTCILLHHFTAIQISSPHEYTVWSPVSCWAAHCVDSVFQNGGKVQHCQVAGLVQRPAWTEDQQCSSLQSGSYCDQHPSASCHITQHDGPKLPPALQTNLWPHPPAIHYVRQLVLSVYLHSHKNTLT